MHFLFHFLNFYLHFEYDVIINKLLRASVNLIIANVKCRKSLQHFQISANCWQLDHLNMTKSFASPSMLKLTFSPGSIISKPSHKSCSYSPGIKCINSASLKQKKFLAKRSNGDQLKSDPNIY